MAFVRELDPETAQNDTTKREIATACIRLARAGEDNATNALLALLATLGADGAADLAFEKAVNDSESVTFAAMEAIDLARRRMHEDRGVASPVGVKAS